MNVGKVTEVIRYPVKSMQGEYLSAASVHDYGVEGDRFFAWERSKRPGKHLTIPESPFLLDYDVKLEEKGSLVFIKEGKRYKQGDKEIYMDLESKAGTDINLVHTDPAGTGPAYWDSPLLLTSKASLKELTRLSGREEMDMLRFRPNIVMALGDAEPFLEEAWIGKNLKINDVILHIEKGCERCAYINFDSKTQEVDSNVLKTVVKENKQIFGIYASVKKPGTINIDDSIEVLG
ncbi:MOSC domain-containing protein [Pseudalkalibacillus salsuginis]|uniref:MOSC domain-containing protein n=1 Tax=Pseudalkalibacillus salsuginis TaxID=2910972 RepID=UPI001F1FF00C|nr:MOSC domain-containing protein [Pseudalkalibacillus salsuginis]MCF6410841.1 MOSC domain-containing protein [Pseudalkalibacillus salsuginis]